nr:GyrI-like domain-containing protein [Eggerthella sinensis]
MAGAFDFKKAYPDLYLPKTKPAFIDVPPMSFVMVAGTGNPNEENGSYSDALGLLYAFSFTIKMSKMGSWQPEGYFDYAVPPLEGLWWTTDEAFDGTRILDKDAFSWISMIRLPDFVTPAVFAWAAEQVAAKKPQLDLARAHLGRFAEGPCAQIMHKAPTTTSPPPSRRWRRSSPRRSTPTTSRTRRAPTSCWPCSTPTAACPRCACTTKSTWATRGAPSRRTSRRSSATP